MAFDEVRLPDDVERGAIGGPLFKTTVLTLASGFEKRNIDWSVARAEFDIGYGISKRTDLDAVINFFWARQGKARGFRFKDWSDFSTIQNTNGNLGTGDGVITQFQARKQYASGPTTYQRTLKKLVSGTVKPFFDGVEQTTGFTVDLNTGIITFSPAVSNGVVVSLTTEFDVPVRFDTDKLNVSVETFDTSEISGIPLVELRVA